MPDLKKLYKNKKLNIYIFIDGFSANKDMPRNAPIVSRAPSGSGICDGGSKLSSAISGNRVLALTQ